MSLADLVGAAYGPETVAISAAKVAEFVDVTGDETARWSQHAPPSYAGALLFVVAPRFLFSDRARPFTRVLIHSDQLFRWHRPLRIGDEMVVSAGVARVRARDGMSIVTFSASMQSGGEAIVESESTFVMSGDAGPDPGPDRPEPPVERRAASDRVHGIVLGTPGSDLVPLSKSASRLDLVRYAGASGDFNPIHFDHFTAREAGFPGVIAHGLLVGAWAGQLAAAGGTGVAPLIDLRLRFHNPLYPGSAAMVRGRVDEVAEGRASLRLAVDVDGLELATGRATVRRE